MAFSGEAEMLWGTLPGQGQEMLFTPKSRQHPGCLVSSDSCSDLKNPFYKTLTLRKKETHGVRSTSAQKAARSEVQ